MNKRLLTFSIVASLSIVSLTGCGSKADGLQGMPKSELITAYEELQTNYRDLNTKYNDLSSTASAIEVTNSADPIIGYVSNGTGELTFNSKDAKVIFPTQFQYPSSSQVKANGQINLSDNISVAPGSNWVCKLNGTTLELEHSSGMSGIIKVGQLDSGAANLSFEDLRDNVLNPWFEGNKMVTSKVAYSSIFVQNSTNAVGADASLSIYIDSEDAYLDCGMASVSGNTLTYVFVYRSESDDSKNESIKTLLNSIKINGGTLQIQ